MQQRDIDPAGSKLTMRPHYNPTVGLIDSIELELQTPPDFPEKYRDAIVNAMELCAVKKHMAHPPRFSVTTVAG